MADQRTEVRCAIYTRKSSEEGLEQSFNSLDAQREACLAYIGSQKHEGWRPVPEQYDDGGYSGGNMDRPALARLMEDISAGRVDTVVVYKVDRLTRALSDFAKIIDQFDQKQVSFVSVTQQFNTTSSMGRLTLNVLLSFAQFEREVTGERIRDKIAASKKKGMWMGGRVPLGYDAVDRRLVINQEERKTVEHVFRTYLELGCVTRLRADLEARGIRSKSDRVFSRGALYLLLKNPIYTGQVRHKKLVYTAQHDGLIGADMWNRVQAGLQANIQGTRHRARTRHASLLAGLIFDDRGNRMTPKHARKHGKRYRYYVSQAIIKGDSGSAGIVARMPAHELEQAVGFEFCRILGEGGTGLGAADFEALPAGKAIRKKASESAGSWPQMGVADRTDLLHRSHAKVVVHASHCLLTFSRRAILEMLGVTESAESPDRQISARINLTVRNGSAMVNTDGCQPPAGRDATPLLRAIARARHWYEQLINGSESQLALARKSGVDMRFVSRQLRLAILPPELVERIAAGRAKHLTLKNIYRNHPDTIIQPDAP